MLSSIASWWTQAILPQAGNQCIPINDLFTSALAGPFNLLAGGVGGITIKFIVVIALIVILVRALINVIRARRAHEDIGAIPMVLLAVTATILGILIVNTIFQALNGSC